MSQPNAPPLLGIAGWGFFVVPIHQYVSDEFVPSTAPNRNRVSWFSDQPACVHTSPY